MASKARPGNGPGADNGQNPDDLARKIARQAVYERALPRRFYEKVEVRANRDAFELALDSKPVRTPVKNALVLPNAQMAEAVGEEWSAQGEHVDPDTMPVTRLANTTIDRVMPRRQETIDEIVSYAGSDLLCYRASDPRELVARQIEQWDPLLDWIAGEIGNRFTLVEGVIHQEQPAGTLAAVRNAIELHDDFTLTGLHNVMTLT
ncbi:MAG: ATP12 family chaperone protein, partial [Hyphomicrobiales bacterium]